MNIYLYTLCTVYLIFAPTNDLWYRYLSFHQKHISQKGEAAKLFVGRASSWEAYHKMGVVFDNQGMHDEAHIASEKPQWKMGIS